MIHNRFLLHKDVRHVFFPLQLTASLHNVVKKHEMESVLLFDYLRHLHVCETWLNCI